MLLQSLREEVLEANLELVRRGLVLYTFGNASGIDRAQGLVAIKPSGVPYDQLTPEQIVVSDLTGKIVDGNLRPSSDLATHLELYKQFSSIGGVAHTHSEYATAWAQAETPIPCFGTTHADSFHGPIPVTDRLSSKEIDGDYELETGIAICRAFSKLDPNRNRPQLNSGSAGRRSCTFLLGSDCRRGRASRGDSGICGPHGQPHACHQRSIPAIGIRIAR